ncbi:hypothetical protein FM020_05140 [Acinetobacter tandoii]|nr:hypothetical protein FM020_05140 [Acinetobacter tandoii]
MREDIELLLSFSKMFDRISNAKAIQQNKERILTDFLKAYYSDMYEIEKLHLGDKFDKADKKSCINFKRKIFEKYWHNHESYYEPCSCGDSASFDWEKVSDIKLYEKGDDFQQLYLISITYKSIFDDSKLYIIEYKDGRLGIQHQFFEVI